MRLPPVVQLREYLLASYSRCGTHILISTDEMPPCPHGRRPIEGHWDPDCECHHVKAAFQTSC